MFEETLTAGQTEMDGNVEKIEHTNRLKIAPSTLWDHILLIFLVFVVVDS